MHCKKDIQNASLSSPLPASVSVMLGAAVTATTTTLTTVVMTMMLTPRSGRTPKGGREREEKRGEREQFVH